MAEVETISAENSDVLDREGMNEDIVSGGDTSEDTDDETAQAYKIIKKRGKQRAKKRGRRSVWADHIGDDLEDITVTNSIHKNFERTIV